MQQLSLIQKYTFFQQHKKATTTNIEIKIIIIKKLTTNKKTKKKKQERKTIRQIMDTLLSLIKFLITFYFVFSSYP